MKRFNPDMEVVRFGAEDIIVTSGAADMVFDSLMGDGIKANGTVTFDGVSYTLTDNDVLNDLCLAIENKYGRDTYYVYIGNDSDTLPDVFDCEISTGLETGWAGSYKYDANSKMFIKLKQ